MKLNTLQFRKALCTALFSLLLGAAGITDATAQTFTVGNLNYSINEDGATVTVTGHVDGTNASGDLVIPESVEYYNTPYVVTIIADNAFSGCSGLTGSLIIPETVTSIGGSAFNGCSGFTGSLTISNSVIYLGTSAFSNCSGFTGTLTIGSSLASTGQNVFKNCTGFTTLNYNAVNCNVMDARIYSNQIIVGNAGYQPQWYHWLWGCSSLTTVNINENVQRIPHCFLDGCSSVIGELVIPESVTVIGWYAFRNCTGYSGTLTIPQAITEIGNSAFGNCTGFTTLNYNAVNCTSMHSLWLSGVTSLTSLSIGERVQRIPADFVNEFSSITGSLTIPNSVIYIGANAFSNCSGLSGTLTLGSSVSQIGNSAFFGSCANFTSMVVWAETPPTLGTNVFVSANYNMPVQVPCGSLDAYQNASDWDVFTNIQEPNPCLWEISATADPSNGGTITGAGVYEQGSTCTLTATPNEGISFVNWTEDGVEVSTDAEYSFTVEGSRSLVAHFVIPTYTITTTINLSDAGTISSNATIFDFEDERIPSGWNYTNYPWTVTTPAYGGYNGSFCMMSGNGGINNSTSSIEVTVDYYEDGTVSFMALCMGEGTLTAWDKCQFFIDDVQQFNYGANVLGWNRYIYDVSVGPHTFKWSYSKDSSVHPTGDAFFVDDVSFGNVYYYGDICTLTATPSSEDYVFLNWTENGEVVSSNAQYSFIVTNSRDLVANFKQVRFEITASSISEICGTVTGSGKYMENQTCTLTATPNEGYLFLNWTENGEVVSTNAEYSFSVTSNRNLVAKFTEPNAIVFVDPNVESICLANWDTNSSGFLTYSEAAAVTNLNQLFRGNDGITSFDELQYFTGLTSINAEEFYGCNNLASVAIPSGVTNIGDLAFGNNSLTSLSFYATNCSVSYYWLNNCSSIVHLTIGDNVQVIPDNFVRGQSNLTGTLVIPASVTSIGSSAFTNCTGFTGSLNLPQYVTSIGGSAFEGCTGFTGSLTLPTALISIGGNAFNNCSGLTGILTIPEEVTSIGFFAFAGTGFTTLNFNAVNCGSLRCYGYYNGQYNSYYSCLVGLDHLTTLNIGPNVQTIPECAFKDFSGCTGNLVIPNSVTYIGGNAFNGCAGYTGNLIIPSSVTTIGNSAFAYCSGFETLTIGPNVTSIGNSAFANMNISTVNFNAINCSDCSTPFSNSNNLATVNIGNNVLVIPNYIFNNCTSLTGELIIPESVISIGVQAFYNCSNLTALHIGNNVQTISNQAFRYCDGLRGELILPESLVTIENHAFNSCSGFTGNLVIPNSVSQIGYYAFLGCSGFTGTLTIGESVSYMGYSTFSGTNFDTMNFNAANCEIQYNLGNDDFVSSFTGCNSITQLNFGENVQSISSNAFRNLDHLTGNLILPNSLVTIGDRAFYNCYGFESIVMGNSVETIGTEAFRNCGGLHGELTLPETLQTVGNYAFASCDELSTINYNAINCTEMGNAQQPIFYDCASIAHINIGENVQSIPNYAFKRCSTVTDMTVAAVVPPTIEASTFGTVSRSIPVNVPFGSGDDYRSAQYWEEFFNIIEGIGQNNYANHWQVDINQFPFNMTAIGIIQIDGVEQTNEAFEIGAFCGNQCRGSQLLTYYPQLDRYLVFLTLCGEQGDLLTFRLYNHELGEESVLGCTSIVTFEDNGMLGSLNAPYVFNFTNIQNTALNRGWTWYSTFVELNGINGLEMMEQSLGENGVMIKSHSDGFLTYDMGVWMGNLNSVNNESMYLINTNAKTVLSIAGNYAVPAQHTLTLNPGWNWIGYPVAKAADVNVALANLNASVGDIVKTQSGFATYADDSGWIGSFNTFNPGVGMMYYSAKNVGVSFTYADDAKGGELRQNITADGNHYITIPGAYPFNMNMMAVVELEDVELHSGVYELAAFVGNECRGSVRLMDVEALNRYMAFLTIDGNETAMLSFRLLDVETGMAYECDQNIEFEADAIVGSLVEPTVLRFMPSTTDNVEMTSYCEIYPNPVKAGEWIKLNWRSNLTSRVKVETVNALGSVVSAETVNCQPASMKAPATPGVYFLRITMEDNGCLIYKLIVE